MMRSPDGYFVSLNNIIKKQDTPSSKALKKIVEEKGDFVEARKLYGQALKDTILRDSTISSKASGKTLEQTVEMFIKEGFLPKGVKPHAYDTSKEMDLAVSNYGGGLGAGFREFMVRKNKTNEAGTIFSENMFSPYNVAPQDNQTTKQINGFVSSFVDKSSKTNVVTLRLPDSQLPFAIGIGNKTGDLTPLQKDLIEIGGRLNDKEIGTFRHMAEEWKNFDYDAFLSLIQHYKQDADFMARAIK